MTNAECRKNAEARMTKYRRFRRAPPRSSFVIDSSFDHSSFVILPVFVVVLRLEVCFLLSHTTVA